MLNYPDLIPLYDHSTRIWHQDPSSLFPLPSSLPSLTALHRLTLQNHRANFDLWHQEDAARDPAASDHTIAETKHTIDRLNQLRNNLAEQIDEAILAEAPAQNPSAPLHSESPGLILDRLSILSLKIHHTADEAHRTSATEEHRAKNQSRLDILRSQRHDLAVCLDQLWSDILAGRRRVKLYRQMKMYNDPELNPVLYGTPH